MMIKHGARWWVALIFPLVAFAQESLPLAGSWRFALDRSTEELSRPTTPAAGRPLTEGRGLADHWNQKRLADKIILPGLLQAQGYGDDISPTTPWVLTLGDAWWQLQSSALRERFSQPGHVEVPFLSQPPKHYLGAAWYQRDIEIPESWRGRQVSLFLERPHWESRAWLDDTDEGTETSLAAPHVHRLGAIKPGHHVLSIRIDNRRIVNEVSGNGHQDDAHSVSDALGAAWNGIVGDISLRATPVVAIDLVQAFPDLSAHAVRLHVRIANATGKAGTGKLLVGGVTQDVSWTNAVTEADLTVPLPAGIGQWDEFHPVMQHVDVLFISGGDRQKVPVSFGLREVSARGKDLLVNGRVTNLRLTHFGGDFPLTGAPPTDVESWKRIFRVCQAYGLNGMRFHSWCPPDEAFAAADQLGFYLQPECPFWAPFNPGNAYTNFLQEETTRILEAYGNHPSFLLLSASNEPGGRYPLVTPAWAKQAHERDPRRLYSAGTGWADPSQVTGGAQYASLVRYNHEELRNSTGWFGEDYRKALTDVNIPVVSHEVGQWCAYPDFDVIKKFTGYLQPGNYRIFRAIAESEGVLPYDHEFAYASGRFQVECYKEEIEANLRTPGLAGFAILDLHDYLGQGTALIGVTDAFWEPKSYVTAGEFREFSGPVVPLARLKTRRFTSNQTLESDVELANFGGRAIEKAIPEWQLVDARGKVVFRGGFGADGKTEKTNLPEGKNIALGHIRLPLARLKAPGQFKLVVGLQGSAIRNSWSIWIYPPVAPEPAAATLVTDDWAQASATLAKGGSVLFLPERALDPAISPKMNRLPVFWNIQMTVRPPRNPTPKFDAMMGLWCDASHPALAGFPTETSCDWQWAPLVDEVRSVNLRKAPANLKPIVSAIDDWNRNWRLGVIFECSVGPGRLLVSVIDLNRADPGAQALRHSLLAYMGSTAFKPVASMAEDDVRALWTAGVVSAPVSAPRALDPDLDDGTQHKPPAR